MDLSLKQTVLWSHVADPLSAAFLFLDIVDFGWMSVFMMLAP